MAQRTLVIAEPGMTWDRDLDKAYRLIDAAKECDADVVKFQWTSNGRKIQERRKVDPKYAAIYERGVQYPASWLELLKGHCDRVGIEFACTTYLIEDIAVVAPLVKRFKVSAYESKWEEFIRAHDPAKEIIISQNGPINTKRVGLIQRSLRCVSEYPTRLEKLNLSLIRDLHFDGLSDHTANVLTGALAVAAGAKIVEAHIRLWDTPKDNPDFGHSLVAEPASDEFSFSKYVSNIRLAEKAL